MARKVRIPVRSLGEEAETPSPGMVASWIRSRIGAEGDLITCRLELSLRHQKGIEVPCVGGEFYGERWLHAIEGIEEGRLVNEPGTRPEALLMDASALAPGRKQLWWAIPSPSTAGIEDRYFHDHEEFLSSIGDSYLRLMRATRDAGVFGHVILCRPCQAEEMELFSGRRRFLHACDASEEDLCTVLELQQEIAIPKELILPLSRLLGEYTVRRVLILDPDAEALSLALEHFDLAQLITAGYCQRECGKYWESLSSRSFVTR